MAGKLLVGADAGGAVRGAGLFLLFLLGLGAPAHAQSSTPDPMAISPLRVVPEINNVNVTTGRTTPAVPVLSIPAAPNLRFDRAQNAALYVFGVLYENHDMGSYARRYTVHLGEASDLIECFDFDPCESKSRSGALFARGQRRYQQPGTGIAYTFGAVHLVTPAVNWERKI